MSIASISTLDEYLRRYGALLGKKAMDSLKPLHVPDVDPLPDFGYVAEHNPDREPFEPQKHVIAATAKMLDEAGSGFICGEMGTGKTLIGMLSVHEHAKGKPYRGLVLCPDHLIPKWIEEIEDTIPGAKAVQFKDWKGIAALLGQGYHYDKVIEGDVPVSTAQEVPVSTGVGTSEDVASTPARNSGETVQRLARWPKPEGPEWYVLGRNQAKWLPKWIGIGEEHRGFDKENHKERSARVIKLGRNPKKDKQGRDVVDQTTGRTVFELQTAKGFMCPVCGTVVINKDGSPMSVAGIGKNQMACDGRFLRQIPNPDTTKVVKAQAFERIYRECDKHSGREQPATFGIPHVHLGKEFNRGGRHYRVEKCGEPLYNYVSKPYRWPPARLIQKKMRKFFGYLVIDEVHEQKSDESAQSMACGKLMASVSHTLALTGTLIGGYANHIFPLMIRMTPETLREEGFKWGKDLEFSESYGRVDLITTTKTGGDDDVVVTRSRRSTSMRRARTGGKPNQRKAVKPGIMPTLYGRHALGTTIFISLNEMADELPPIYEYVSDRPEEARPDNYDDGAPDRKPADYDTNAKAREDYDDAVAARFAYDEWLAMYVPAIVDLDEEHKPEYDRVENALVQANNDLMKRGSMKLASTMLHTLLAYPDKPDGWGHDEASLIEASNAAPAPALLGQSFLKHFNHEFDAASKTLILTKDGETDRIPLRKDGGIWWLDVTFDGKETKSFAYDTGAATISIPYGMAADLGLTTPKKGDREAFSQIADGSIVKGRRTTADSVTVGRFTVSDVECTIDLPGGLAHTVGYWLKPKIATPENWCGVVTPTDLSQETIRPKEQALLDICKMHKKAGNQCWVYVQMTGKRDVTVRLKALLEADGLSVGILRANTVEPKERIRWIAANGKDYDVIISHPKLVSTGVDLFGKSVGSHNFNTLIFYETGYNTFDMQQASRRSWRIGQTKPCYVYYLHYRDTMQHRAMMLISRKVSASNAIKGDLTVEGLAALAGEDNAQMAMARELAGNINDSDVQRNWGKVKAGSSKKPRSVKEIAESVAFDDEVPLPGEPSAFDDLGMEAQLIGETTVAVEKKKAKRKPAKIVLPPPVAEEEGVYDDEPESSPRLLSREEVAKLLADCEALGLDSDLFL